MIEPAGPLSPADPLHALLARVAGEGDYDVFFLNGRDGAVYLYVNRHSGVRVVGKFYGRKWVRGTREGDVDLRVLLMHRELEHLEMLRALGFDHAPHVVPCPLAADAAIGCVLLEEYVEGVNLHHGIWDAVVNGNRDPLFRSIAAAASFLAHLHLMPPPPKLMPRKEPLQYLRKLLMQLRQWNIAGDAECARLESIGAQWERESRFGSGHDSIIHGDATPEHFLFNEPVQQMNVIDVESLRHGDPAEDLGYLAAELKHLGWMYGRDSWAAEPYINHLYGEYRIAADLLPKSAVALTQRARFPMACAELRIARNDWLPLDYRHRLIAEAEQCMRI